MTSTRALEKCELRQQMRMLRQRISPERRQKSGQAASAEICRRFPDPMTILSYVSFNDEFDTTYLNNQLAEEGRLLLPLVSGGKWRVYWVENLGLQIHQNPWGFPEPHPYMCEEAAIEDIDLIIAPALAFDSRYHRLGYGKGYFDRFLTGRSLVAYGLGFTEQLLPHDLPTEDHDVALHGLFLY